MLTIYIFFELKYFLKGGMPSMKTGINNIYRGFRGRRTRFSSEILRFLNDFFDFWPFFSQKIENC
jgi:hypothetical protein